MRFPTQTGQGRVSIAKSMKARRKRAFLFFAEGAFPRSNRLLASSLTVTISPIRCQWRALP
jgi:hypothetical protein